MHKIHEFDSALREAFVTGAHDRGVYFIRRDAADRLVPCSPNKLFFSKLTSIRPGKRLLPTGFQTVGKTVGRGYLKQLDDRVARVCDGKLDGSSEIALDLAVELLQLAYKNLEFSKDAEDESRAHIAALEHLSKTSSQPAGTYKVFFIAASGRSIKRIRLEGRFANAPDTQQQATLVERHAKHIPALILLRQNGLEEDGWRGLPFWWPVIVAPMDSVTSVFAAEAPAVAD